jgi:N-acyl-D-amino-acid deacylase
MAVRYAYSNIPLTSDPGTKYAYSNFGYIMLGRIIEEVSGMRYEEYIRQEILTPWGISRMAIAGDSPEEARAGEVRYYDYPDAPLVPSIFGDGPREIPAPYDYHGQLVDSCGGWIASAVDLVRYSESYDGRRGAAILKPQTIQLMIERVPSLFANPNWWYGLGWMVQPDGNSVLFWHDGYIPGTRAFLIHFSSGVSMAVLFNSSPEDPEAFFNDFANSLVQALSSIKSWPAHDLFPGYDNPQPGR